MLASLLSTHNFSDEIFKDGYSQREKALASAKEIISNFLEAGANRLGLLSSIMMMKEPIELAKHISNDFYLFINFYLKLEIFSIQKYIFDLIFYLLRVTDSPTA